MLLGFEIWRCKPSWFNKGVKKHWRARQRC